MLLHRLRMFYRILVKIQYHLCLWVKILPCRGQHDPCYFPISSYFHRTCNVPTTDKYFCLFLQLHLIHVK